PPAVTTGIILAGGRSERMGAAKAMLELDGRPLIAHVADRLRTVCDRIIVVGHDREPARVIGAELVLEDPPHPGPLHGLLAGLRAATSTALVTSCDSPLVVPELLERLVAALGTADAAACLVDDRLQPLPAVYGTRCLQVADT